MMNTTNCQNYIEPCKRGLPVGYDLFNEVIEQNFLFIDKTPIIKELIDSNDKVTIITRPRRFGKTLTLSMLECFLSKDYEDLQNPTLKAQKLFSDLQIFKDQNFCLQHMGKYPVIFLSFKDLVGTTFEQTLQQFKTLIQELLFKFDFILQDLKSFLNATNEERNEKFTSDQIRTLSSFNKENYDYLNALNGMTINDQATLSEFLKFFILVLFKYFNKQQIILLLDEYDVPLHTALNHGYYNQMLGFMKPIMGVIKNNPYIYKVVLSGCLRIAQESFFTGTNNFNHYGIEQEKYSTTLGFDKDETIEILKFYNLEDQLDEIIKWYDGYVFGSNKIVCPWDVIRYCEEARNNKNFKPNSYWINTSRNSILDHFLNRLNEFTIAKIQDLIDNKSIYQIIDPHLILDDLIDNPKQSSLSANLSDQAFWTILYHAGYLTRDLNPFNTPTLYEQDPKLLENQNLRILKIPNKEVLEYFESRIKYRFSHANNFYRSDAQKLLELFLKEPSQESASEIADQLSFMLYNTISVRDHSTNSKPEEYYHAFMNGIFSTILSNPNFANINYKSNIELGKGYADLAFVAPLQLLPQQTGVIIELKVAKNEELLFSKTAEALQQIKSQNYAKGMFKLSKFMNLKQIYIYGIAFCGKDCFVAAEKLLPNQFKKDFK